MKLSPRVPWDGPRIPVVDAGMVPTNVAGGDGPTSAVGLLQTSGIGITVDSGVASVKYMKQRSRCYPNVDARAMGWTVREAGRVFRAATRAEQIFAGG